MQLFQPTCLAGLLIYIQFLTDVKSVLHAVSMAWSLQLHLSGHRLDQALRYSQDVEATVRFVEELRVLGYLYTVERRAAILTNTPS